MYLEMIGAACTYLLELDIDKYLTVVEDNKRSESLFSMEGVGNMRYNESFAFTEQPEGTSAPKQHQLPESPQSPIFDGSAKQPIDVY